MKRWGVEFVPATKKRSALYKTKCSWGSAPWQQASVNLGRGLGASGCFDHPMKAHLSALQLVRASREFQALRAAVDECLLLRGSAFTLKCEGQTVTAAQQLATSTALYNAIAQFWVLSPDDQRALPFLVRELEDNNPARSRALMTPVGVLHQLPGADLVSLDGYFDKSTDKAVLAAFSTLSALGLEARTAYPKGKFHALVLEERHKALAADVGLVMRSSRFKSACTPTEWPAGFGIGASEPIPTNRRDPAFLNAGDMMSNTTVAVAEEVSLCTHAPDLLTRHTGPHNSA